MQAGTVVKYVLEYRTQLVQQGIQLKFWFHWFEIGRMHESLHWDTNTPHFDNDLWVLLAFVFDLSSVVFDFVLGSQLPRDTSRMQQLYPGEVLVISTEHFSQAGGPRV